MIKSFDRRFQFGILALIFLLTVGLSDVTLSKESQPGEQNILRRASLEWMQVGMKQYSSDLFTEAERSFRRALVFQKYLTDAEREKLNEYLANARIGMSKGEQAVADTDESVEQDQPVKTEEKVKESKPLAQKSRQQTEEESKIKNSQTGQKDQSVKTAEPSVSKIQVEAESSQDDVIIVKDNSFRGKYMRLSDMLLQNRRNVLMIGLPALAVLVIIMKLQGIRRRPGRRVYAYQVPANTSFIGAKLASSNEAIKDLKKGRSAVAAVPERKSFEQSTEHWKEKHAGHKPDSIKPSRKSEKWPQRKDKLQAGDSAVTKAGQKQCRKCEETKAHTDFHKNKSSKDGLASWCKDCKKEYRKKRAARKK